MIDLQTKLAIAAILAWALTRRVTPAGAVYAHRIWLAVAALPAIWLAASWTISPVVVARLRADLLPVPVVDPSPAVRQAAFAVYVAVALLLAVRLAWGVASVRRLVRESRPLSESELAHVPSELRACRVRVSALALPVTAGFVKPVILVPSDWRSLSPSALEAILRHEIAHVRRRDGLIGLACGLLEVFFWFNPAAWMVGANVRWFAEMACDHAAAKIMSRDTYASELLALAAGWKGARRPAYTITAGAETNVSRRLDLLLQDSENVPRQGILIAASLAFVAALPLSAAMWIGGVSADAPSTPSPHAHSTLHQLRHRH